MTSPKRRTFKFIGCEILYRETCRLAAQSPHRVDVEFLRKGLHDLETTDMVAKIQSAIDATDSSAGYEAILLGYARCNDGLVGIAAGDLPLVLPRAHDCITLFFGSRQAYQDYFDQHPGTYYMTTGWAERNNFEAGDYTRPAYDQQGVMAKLGLHESYEQLVARHGKDNADYIVATLGDWTQNYTDLLYLEMGVCDESPFVDRAKELAREHGWAFERRKGSWSLIERLFSGQWDDDFLIVQPGQRIVASNDRKILDSQPQGD